jgi:hypothetical protein
MRLPAAAKQGKTSLPTTQPDYVHSRQNVLLLESGWDKEEGRPVAQTAAAFFLGI